MADHPAEGYATEVGFGCDAIVEILGEDDIQLRFLVPDVWVILSFPISKYIYCIRCGGFRPTN